MATEANRNTPLAVLVAIMAIALVSLTFYSFSDINREVASSSGDKASSAGYGDASSSSGNNAPSAGYGSSEDKAPASGGGSAPGYGGPSSSDDAPSSEASSGSGSAAPGYGP